MTDLRNAVQKRAAEVAGEDPYRVHTSMGQNTTMKALALTHGDKLVGGIQWHKPGMDDARRIDAVWVHPDYRRQGIGTRLKQEAETREGYKLRHSSIRSTEGDAWARATGGPGANFKGLYVGRSPVTDEDYHYFLHHLKTRVVGHND